MSEETHAEVVHRVLPDVGGEHALRVAEARREQQHPDVHEREGTEPGESLLRRDLVAHGRRDRVVHDELGDDRRRDVRDREAKKDHQSDADEAAVRAQVSEQPAHQARVVGLPEDLILLEEPDARAASAVRHYVSSGPMPPRRERSSNGG